MRLLHQAASAVLAILAVPHPDLGYIGTHEDPQRLMDSTADLSIKLQLK